MVPGNWCQSRLDPVTGKCQQDNTEILMLPGMGRLNYTLEPGVQIPGREMRKMGTTLMADRSKKPTPEPTPDESAKKVKYDSPVKFRAEFKEKLDDVAADLGVYPGELVEQHLGDFIHTEWTRILEEKLKRAKQSRPK